MSEPTAFVLNTVDAVDLVHRALRKLEVMTDRGQADEAVSLSIDSILSQAVYQLRNKHIVFAPEQKMDYDTLVKFVS